MNYHYDQDGRKNFNAVEVVEVPGCQFNGFPVCLATKDKKDLHRLKVAAARFNKWYNQQAEKGIVVPSTVGRPIRLN